MRTRMCMIRPAMRVRGLHLLAIGIVLAVVAAAGASAASPVKITNCNKALSRPKQVTLTCADANTGLGKLKWASFGGSSAKASGTLETNTCKPNCAAGKVVRYPVSVTASKPRSCGSGLRVYGKVTLRFTGKAPSSASSLKTWTLSCPGSL
jgi:hypothetical protein